MTTPDEEIKAYLEHSETTEPRRLGVAIVFAECMLQELRASVAAWQATAAALHDLEDVERRVAARSGTARQPPVGPKHSLRYDDLQGADRSRGGRHVSTLGHD